nr:MAG TPA: hypothetical protein [Caudoviricetes sp.]
MFRNLLNPIFKFKERQAQIKFNRSKGGRSASYCHLFYIYTFAGFS